MTTLTDFYDLKSLVRYNTRRKIISETVAEHSYFVSLFTMIICDELQVDDSIKVKALEYAIIHDIPEIDTSDIPYPVKKSNPELSKLLTEMEVKSIRTRLGFYYATLFRDIEVDLQLEWSLLIKTIVKLADALSVIQYCENEISLGNANMEEILDDAKVRVKNYKTSLYHQTRIWVTLGGN